MKQYEVYLITNLINDKKYVGFTSVGISERWSKHKTRTNRSELNRAILESGPSNFKIEVLERYDDLLDAMISELQMMRKYNSLSPHGYNIIYTGEARKLQSKNNKLEKSDLIKNSISNTLTGHVQSPETVERRVSQIRREISCSNGSTYPSVREASRQLKIPVATICHAISGYVKSPRHGLTFTFTDREI